MEAQYIVDEEGNRRSVVLSVEDYERLLEAAGELADAQEEATQAREELEDHLAAKALAEDRARIERGEEELVPWEEVRDKIGSEYESS